MGQGILQVKLSLASGALPVSNIMVLLKNENGHIIYQLRTDLNGMTPRVVLDAPDKSCSQYPHNNVRCYGVYGIEVIPAGGLERVHINGVTVYDTITSILPVQMRPCNIDAPAKPDVYNIRLNSDNTMVLDDFLDH